MQEEIEAVLLITEQILQDFPLWNQMLVPWFILDESHALLVSLQVLND